MKISLLIIGFTLGFLYAKQEPKTEDYYRLYIVNNQIQVIDNNDAKIIYTESLYSKTTLSNSILKDNE